MIKCDTCGERAEESACMENDICEPCFDKWLAEQLSYWRPRFEAERIYRDYMKLAEEYGPPEGNFK